MKKRFIHKQRGAVAIIVGICIFVLVGFAGLVGDLGHLFIVKAELQNGMDSCALAAAKELTGVSGTQLQTAENAGISVGNVNRVDYQGPNLALVPTDVTFSATLNGTYQTRSAVEAGGAANVLAMKYARCTLPQGGIQPYFMHLLGIGTKDMSATAVATLAPSITTCGIPLAMCKKTPPASCPCGGSPGAHGHCPGQWYDGKFEAGGGSTGNFNWIDFSPPSGGASEMNALISGTGQCNLNVPNPVGQTGIVSSSATHWNSRFGLYKNGSGNPQAAGSPPDFTGYSYTPTNWASQCNATADFRTKRTAYASYGNTVDTVAAGNAITSLSINNSFNVSSHGAGGQHQTAGADRRLATAPIVDCSAWASSQTTPIIAWACVLMLHPIDGTGDLVYMEYLGLASEPGSPCATTGLPGGPGGTGPKVPALVQ